MDFELDVGFDDSYDGEDRLPGFTDSEYKEFMERLRESPDSEDYEYKDLLADKDYIPNMPEYPLIVKDTAEEFDDSVPGDLGRLKI